MGHMSHPAAAVQAGWLLLEGFRRGSSLAISTWDYPQRPLDPHEDFCRRKGCLSAESDLPPHSHCSTKYPLTYRRPQEGSVREESEACSGGGHCFKSSANRNHLWDPSQDFGILSYEIPREAVLKVTKNLSQLGGNMSGTFLPAEIPAVLPKVVS